MKFDFIRPPLRLPAREVCDELYRMAPKWDRLVANHDGDGLEEMIGELERLGRRHEFYLMVMAASMDRFPREADSAEAKSLRLAVEYRRMRDAV